MLFDDDSNANRELFIDSSGIDISNVGITTLRDGKIGIGTKTPESILHVMNTAEYTINDTPNGQDSILLHVSGVENNNEIDKYYGGITWYGSRRRAGISAVREKSDADFVGLAFHTQGTEGGDSFAESMRISHSGNVGIGTKSPDISLAIGDGDTGFDYTSDGNFGVKTQGNWRMYWNDQGNVGIGTNVPNSDSTLHVNGTTILSNDVIIGTTSFGTNGERLIVNGPTKLEDSVGIGGDPTSSDKLRVVGNIKATGNSIIDGTSVLASNVRIGSTGIGGQTERLYVNGPTMLDGEVEISGNFGIGTASPDCPLHVKSNDNEPIAKFEGDGDTIVLIQGNNTNDADEVGLAIKGDSSKDEYWFIGTEDVNYSANSLNFVASDDLNMENSECKMTLTRDGYLGIGISTPGAPLVVATNNSYPISNGYQLRGTSPAVTTAGNNDRSISIWASESITADKFFARSDRRIKEDIIPLDDATSLNIINNIESYTYNYIDPEKATEEKVIGFIAQEVNNILPNAIKLCNHYIPDELRLLESLNWTQDESGNNILIVDNLNYDESHTGKSRFYVSNDLSHNEHCKDVMCMYDDEMNKTNKFIFERKWEYVFFYGKEVDDFHTIDKSQIYALYHSAIQQLSKMNDEKTAQIATLQQENASMQERLTSLEARLLALENK